MNLLGTVIYDVLSHAVSVLILRLSSGIGRAGNENADRQNIACFSMFYDLITTY